MHLISKVWQYTDFVKYTYKYTAHPPGVNEQMHLCSSVLRVISFTMLFKHISHQIHSQHLRFICYLSIMLWQLSASWLFFVYHVKRSMWSLNGWFVMTFAVVMCVNLMIHQRKYCIVIKTTCSICDYLSSHLSIIKWFLHKYMVVKFHYTLFQIFVYILYIRLRGNKGIWNWIWIWLLQI